ncbi:MAG: Flp pilus assembly protein CpaB [Bdellovibrionales bacterium]|nr:Flp pilus assembly protein CpaB [Bdellovibrionales bacterium]
MEQNETRTLWISIGAAVFAVFLLYGWAQDKRASYAKKFGQSKTVVVAREDILEFAIIDAEKLEVIEKPSEFIEPDAIDNPSQAIGLIALAPIKKGEQILETKLVMPGTTTGLSIQVSPGKRAVTIPVDETRGLARLLKPGDRVDIIAAIDDGAGVNKTRKIRTVLQDVPILATGQSIVDQLPIKVQKGEEDNYEIRNLRVENDYKTVTVEVKPDEAQSLYYLSSVAAPIYLSLRNPNDRLQNPLRTIAVDDVLKKVTIKKAVPIQRTMPKPAPKPKAQPKRGRYEKI